MGEILVHERPKMIGRLFLLALYKLLYGFDFEVDIAVTAINHKDGEA